MEGGWKEFASIICSTWGRAFSSSDIMSSSSLLDAKSSMYFILPENILSLLSFSSSGGFSSKGIVISGVLLGIWKVYSISSFYSKSYILKSSYFEDPLVCGSRFAVPRNWSLILGSASNLLAPVLRPLVPVNRLEFVTSASGDSSLMISQAVVGPLSCFSPLCYEAAFSSNACTFIIRT